LSADFTALLRSRASSFCRLRLIWDLMFATEQSLFEVWDRMVRQRRGTNITRDPQGYQRATERAKSVPAARRADCAVQVLGLLAGRPFLTQP
jgi:hypothetical protein